MTIKRQTILFELNTYRYIFGGNMNIISRLFARKELTIKQELIRRMLTPRTLTLYDPAELDLKAKVLGLESTGTTMPREWWQRQKL